jgi:hypothetical protein
VSITPTPGDPESISSNDDRMRHPATDTLADIASDAMKSWPAALRLCLIGLAFSLPALAIILVLLTH